MGSMFIYIHLQVERSLNVLKDVQSTFRLRLIRVYLVYIYCLLEDAAMILACAASVARSKFSLLKRDVTESIGVYIGFFLCHL